MNKKKLRSGYTTGACAAAAAKAAVLLLLQNIEHLPNYRRAGRTPSKLPAGRQNTDKSKDSLGSGFPKRVFAKGRSDRALGSEVDIPFPDGSRVSFKIHNSTLKTHNSQLIAEASVIKDAGDDPDVTNRAEIKAEVKIKEAEKIENNYFSTSKLIIKGGKGVGTVTKPGLPVPVGEPAINPVPIKMIKEAIKESLEFGVMSLEKKQMYPNLNSELRTPNSKLILEITISVPAGEELAKKTLNSRLGIIGGISILGTTGIVKPVSTDAWTATITSSMDVAVATGQKEIVLSAGRTSEKAHMKKYGLPEESYVLMGDYLEYSLQEAKKHNFRKIHLCAQWAKMVKIAMATPQTHVRFGAIDIKKAVEFLNSLGINVPSDQEFNTAREIFEFISSAIRPASGGQSAFIDVCRAAEKYAEEIATGIPVNTYLVLYNGEIVAANER